ncbi:MAG: DNA-directed RNA polymerase subunit A'' [Candidatus Aenigmarchaeota archaeon]|nr:DNA-directed RNA polymerase subunit A'' [Candidatus Aenigmarchaeota archaeon]
MGANCSIFEVDVIVMDESVIQNVLGLYEEKIDNLDISPKEKTALKIALETRYNKMRYDPGDAVGVVAAQSISEPATQTTLRSYHRAAGAGLNITQGLPRILEIFDARKTPVTPSMKIYLLKEFNVKEKAVEIASSIKETDLKHIMISDSLDLGSMALEVELDKDIIARLDIVPDKIVSAVKRKVKNVNASVDANKLIFEINKDKVTIKDLQALRFKLRDVHVKGIKGITHCIVEKVSDEYVLYTLGSNLMKVSKIEGIDTSRLLSNNIFEIAEVLGIEAARNTLVMEITETLRAQGVDTDVRHLLLVADTMTQSGGIQAIGRYGLSGSKSSVLARANFEETIKHLTDAAVYGLSDELNGIVENVMIGKTAKVGTGLVNIAMKTKKSGTKAAKVKE